MARLQASRSLSTKAIANAAYIGLPTLYSDNRKGYSRAVPKYKSRKQVCTLTWNTVPTGCALTQVLFDKSHSPRWRRGERAAAYL